MDGGAMCGAMLCEKIQWNGKGINGRHESSGSDTILIQNESKTDVQSGRMPEHEQSSDALDSKAGRCQF